jgi:hypothetical protein
LRLLTITDETMTVPYYVRLQSLHVMPALVAGIHVFLLDGNARP